MTEFRRVGVERASIGRIAETAGVSRPSFYFHFPTKDHVLLELQWTLEESEHVLWQHRFDRLNVSWTPAPPVQIQIGRQAVSWATTLFFTPADPFSPFDPADPFREFRAGVDAARLHVYPGALSEIDVVVNDHTPLGGDTYPL